MSTKARLIAASIAAILLGAAHGSGAAAPPDPRLAGTTWRAETITGSPVIDFAASTITFETDGPVHGRGGCNRFSGSATLDGERLSLGALGATMRACAPALMESGGALPSSHPERRAPELRRARSAADPLERRR
jgi:putative lipoprotein